LRSSNYSKVISAIMSAAVLVGLQSVMTATPTRAETTCHLEPQNEGAFTADKCSVRALARNKAAFRAAHAEVGGASEKQRPVVTHCIAARGLPSQRGAWQLGIDRATGHRCWRLVGAIKPHERIVSGAKPSPVPNSSAVSQASTAASANPVTPPTSVEAYRPGQPTEVLTSSIPKLSEAPHVNLRESPISTEAGVISKLNQVDDNELQPHDPRLAWTSGRSLIGKIAAMVGTDTNPGMPSAGNILQRAAVFIPVRGRPALFLVVFLSVLTTVLALYALVAGSLKLLRPSTLRKSPSAIPVTPRQYLENMTKPPRAGSTDEHI
jgi:hypothetical protein